VQANGIQASNNKVFKQQHISYTFIETPPQTLNGIAKLKLVDKGFVTTKMYKKNEPVYKQYASYNATTPNQYHIIVL
jgi:hypothetical protein